MKDKFVVYLHLPKFDVEYLQKLKFEIEYYGIQVKYGDPMPQAVRRDFQAGKRSIVIVSPLLIGDLTNDDFLVAIGQ